MKVFLNSSTGKAVCTWQQAQLRVEKTIKRWYLYQSAILIAIIFRRCRLAVQMYCLQYKISCSNIVAVWFVVGKIYATSLRVLVQIVLKHTQSWKLNISFPYIYSETLLNWTPSIPETPLIWAFSWKFIGTYPVVPNLLVLIHITPLNRTFRVILGFLV